MTNISRRAFSEFTGIPYGAADCVDLLIDVQRRLFDRLLTLPGDRNVARRHFRQLLREQGRRVDIPEVGDIVLMRDFLQRYPAHVGTYFQLAGDGWVLHTTEKTDSVFHRIRHLPQFGINVEGFYQWKPN